VLHYYPHPLSMHHCLFTSLPPYAPLRPFRLSVYPHFSDPALPKLQFDLAHFPITFPVVGRPCFEPQHNSLPVHILWRRARTSASSLDVTQSAVDRRHAFRSLSSHSLMAGSQLCQSRTKAQGDSDSQLPLFVLRDRHRQSPGMDQSHDKEIRWS
jgi:hypothetical protein